MLNSADPLPPLECSDLTASALQQVVVTVFNSVMTNKNQLSFLTFGEKGFLEIDQFRRDEAAIMGFVQLAL